MTKNTNTNITTTVNSLPLAVDTQVWFGRTNKRQNDRDKHDLLLTLPSDRTHNVVVLPGDVWQWEKNLIALDPKRKWKFYGCNNSKRKNEIETFHRVCAETNKENEAKGIPSRFFIPVGPRANLSQLVKVLNQKYSAIYADFCGSWCGENDLSLKTMFKNKLFEDTAYLIITSQVKCPRQRERDFDILRMVVNGGKTVDDDMFHIGPMSSVEFQTSTKGINTLVHANAVLHGYDAELIKFNTYAGDRKGHNMMTFTYKITKN